MIYLVRNIVILVLLTSCCEWSWKPDAYSIDVESMLATNEDGDTIKLTDPEFSKGYWFPDANIADLKVAIDKMKRCSEKTEKSLQDCSINQIDF